MKHTVALKFNHVFQRLYRKGSSAVGPNLALYARKNGREQSRLGLTVSTKVGKAVVRNRTRRRLREIYRLNEDKLAPGYDLVIVARVRAANTPYAGLEKEFLRLVRKLDLLAEASE